MSLEMAARRPALLQISLVIFLRLPKSSSRRNLCRNRLVKLSARLERRFRFRRRRFLLRRMEKNRRAILFSKVRSLPVHLCRIVHVPKRLHQRFVFHLRRIKRHLYHFRVPSRVCAHILIRRTLRLPAAVTHQHIFYSRNHPELRLDSPKASRSKRRQFTHLLLPFPSYRVPTLAAPSLFSANSAPSRLRSPVNAPAFLFSMTSVSSGHSM